MLMSEFSNDLFFPRPEFVLNFTRLRDRWQSAVQSVRQRKSDISGLVRQWQSFTTSEEDLLRFLTDTTHLLSAVKSQDCYSLYQTRSLIHELKVLCAQEQCENYRVATLWKVFIRLRFYVFCDVMVLCNGEASWVGSWGPYQALSLALWGQKPSLPHSPRNGEALLGCGSRRGLEMGGQRGGSLG